MCPPKDTMLAVLVLPPLNHGQEESLGLKSVLEMGQSLRALCFHPKGKRQLMVRVTKPSHPAAPGGLCWWEQDWTVQRDPTSKKGLSPRTSITHCKTGEKCHICSNSTRSPCPGAHTDRVDAAGETEAGSHPA